MQHFGRPSTPGEARGILPLLIAALAAGAGRGLLGGITANQAKQRNKGYINDAYRTASQKLSTEQSYAREGIAESANQRGLAQGGDVTSSPIRTAMSGGVMKGSGAVTNTTRATPFIKGTSTTEQLGPTPTTIGGQIQNNAGVQMGLERQDLEHQHDRALKENRTDYANSLIGAGISGIQTAMSVYSGGQDLSAIGGMGGGAAAAAGGTPTPSPDIGALPAAGMASVKPPSRDAIHAAMLSATSYGGINPIDPLGERSSAWSTHPSTTRLAGDGETNASFNVG